MHRSPITIAGSVLDRTAGVCQAEHMFRSTGKLIAVILAIWLPMFSGNALAMSVTMQTMRGDFHSVAAQQGEPHCASAVQQHAHHAVADQDQSTGHQSAGEDCGACHLACCGYLAAASIEVIGAQPSPRLFAPVAAQFQSIIPTLLDPPPLTLI